MTRWSAPEQVEQRRRRERQRARVVLGGQLAALVQRAAHGSSRPRPPAASL
jgi:hypothetical protein